MTRRFIIYILLRMALLALASPFAAQDACPTPVPIPLQDAPIVFRVNAGIWVERLTESLVLLVDDPLAGSPVLSGDGQTVVYLRGTLTDRAIIAEPDIRAIEIDGSNDRLLLSSEHFATLRAESYPFTPGIYNIGWIPGTHHLLLNTVGIPQNEGLWIPIADDLWLLDAETGELTNLLPQGSGGEFRIAPDGGHIAVLKTDGLIVMASDGSEIYEDVLPGFKAIGFGEYLVYPQIFWAADSLSLLTGIVTGGDPYSSADITAYSVPVTGEPRELGTFDAFWPSFHISPDGTRVLYWRPAAQSRTQREIHFANIDGSDDTLFLQGELIDVKGWDADSLHFVYSPPEDFETRLIGDVCGGEQ